MLARWLDFLQIDSYVKNGRNMSCPASPGTPLGSTRAQCGKRHSASGPRDGGGEEGGCGVENSLSELLPRHGLYP